MERRLFLRGSILGAASLSLVGSAEAQRGRRDGPACPPPPPLRAEWSAEGPLTGRVVLEPDALSADERSHAPVLTLPERVRAGRAFDLVVQIGVRPHETTPEHHVEWIEVSLGERRVLVADLSLDVAYPIVRVPLVVREPTWLTARARCSQHGVWMTRREITLAS